MKFLKYLVALVIGVTMSVSLASCGDDDDDDEPQSSTKNESQSGTNTSYETLIIGEWYRVGGEYGFCFKSDKSGYEFWYYEGTKCVDYMDWSIQGNELTIDYGDNDVTYYEIVSITESEMFVKYRGDTELLMLAKVN